MRVSRTGAGGGYFTREICGVLQIYGVLSRLHTPETRNEQCSRHRALGLWPKDLDGSDNTIF
jgi:hypothetical protein